MKKFITHKNVIINLEDVTYVGLRNGDDIRVEIMFKGGHIVNFEYDTVEDALELFNKIKSE